MKDTSILYASIDPENYVNVFLDDTIHEMLEMGIVRGKLINIPRSGLQRSLEVRVDRERKTHLVQGTGICRLTLEEYFYQQFKAGHNYLRRTDTSVYKHKITLVNLDGLEQDSREWQLYDSLVYFHEHEELFAPRDRIRRRQVSPHLWTGIQDRRTPKS